MVYYSEHKQHKKYRYLFKYSVQSIIIKTGRFKLMPLENIKATKHCEHWEFFHIVDPLCGTYGGYEKAATIGLIILFNIVTFGIPLIYYVPYASYKLLIKPYCQKPLIKIQKVTGDIKKTKKTKRHSHKTSSQQQKNKPNVIKNQEKFEDVNNLNLETSDPIIRQTFEKMDEILLITNLKTTRFIRFEDISNHNFEKSDPIMKQTFEKSDEILLINGKLFLSSTIINHIIYNGNGFIEIPDKLPL